MTPTLKKKYQSTYSQTLLLDVTSDLRDTMTSRRQVLLEDTTSGREGVLKVTIRSLNYAYITFYQLHILEFILQKQLGYKTVRTLSIVRKSVTQITKGHTFVCCSY